MTTPLVKFSIACLYACSLSVMAGTTVILSATDTKAAEKVMRIAAPFGPSSAIPDPRARQNGWYSNKAGVSETLVGIDYDMKRYPRLATSYENISPTEWKIVLREGVKFHDGSIMTAQDAKASFDKLSQEGHPGHNPRLMKLLDLKEIRIVDDKTLIFETNKPNAAFLWALNEPSATVLKEGTDNLPIIGTGPFVFVSADPDKRFVSRAFDDYWGGKPKLDKLIIDAIKDPSAAALALQAGDVDLVTNYSEPDFALLKKKGDSQLFSNETLRLFFFMPRVDGGVLANKTLRKAVSLGLDRDLIVEAALAGVGGTAANSVFPANMKAWVNESLKLPYNLDQAKKLLDDVGIKDTDGNGIRELDGKDIVIRMRTYEGRAALRPTLEISQQLLMQLGLNVEISIGEFAANNDALKAGEIDMNLQAWGTAPQGHPDYFLTTIVRSGAGYNFSGYANPELDALLDKARAEFDDAKAKPLYDQAQVIINDDLPIIPLFHKSQVSVGNGKVVGFKIHPAETYLASTELDIAQD